MKKNTQTAEQVDSEDITFDVTINDILCNLINTFQCHHLSLWLLASPRKP